MLPQPKLLASVMVEISFGTSKENPEPAVVVSLGTETAIKPTFEVSGRSSKSTVSPEELPDVPVSL